MRLADCCQVEGSVVLRSNPHVAKVAFSSEVHIAHLATGGLRSCFQQLDRAGITLTHTSRYELLGNAGAKRPNPSFVCTSKMAESGSRKAA